MNTILQTMSQYHPELHSAIQALATVQHYLNSNLDYYASDVFSNVKKILLAGCIVIALFALACGMFSASIPFLSHPISLCFSVITMLIAVISPFVMPKMPMFRITADPAFHNFENATVVKQQQPVINNGVKLIEQAYPCATKLNVGNNTYIVYTQQPNLTIKPGQTLTTNKGTIVTTNNNVIKNLIIGNNANIVTSYQKHTTSQQLPFINTNYIFHKYVSKLLSKDGI